MGRELFLNGPMRKQAAVPMVKLVSLVAALSIPALGGACAGPAGGGNEASVPPDGAANSSPAAAAKPSAAILVDMPADVEPIFASKCAVCHGRDARGGPVAPNIFEIEEKHTSKEWVAYLRDPKIWDKQMPPIQATHEEYTKLGDWLASVTGKASDKGGGEQKKSRRETKARKA